MTTSSTAPHRRRSIRPSAILQHPEVEHHPAVMKEAEARAASIQLRVADAITAFAGSMWFVYVHIVIFAAWMIWFEPNPWPTLTLVVSLEAIFLSTFVMIGQNRQAAFAQAKADHDYTAQEKELMTNTDLTREIHRLTEELHRRLLVAGAAVEAASEVPGAPAAVKAAGEEIRKATQGTDEQ